MGWAGCGGGGERTYFYNIFLWNPFNFAFLPEMRKRIQADVPDMRTYYSFNHSFQQVLCSGHSDARNIPKEKGNEILFPSFWTWY